MYELSIDNSEKAALPSKRIVNIIDYMTYEIYLYIQRGLFERHKVIFALMLTNKLLVAAGKVSQRGYGSLHPASCLDSGLPLHPSCVEAMRLEAYPDI